MKYDIVELYGEISVLPSCTIWSTIHISDMEVLTICIINLSFRIQLYGSFNAEAARYVIYGNKCA